MKKMHISDPATGRVGDDTGLAPLRSSVRAACLGAVLLGCLLPASCKDDDPPPPLPAPKAVVEAEAPLELKPEDAGLPPVQEVEKPKAQPRSVGLTQCCKALRQNAANAPEPTKGYMLYAAQLCDGAVAQGQGQATAVGMIRSALRGVGLPADCK